MIECSERDKNNTCVLAMCMLLTVFASQFLFASFVILTCFFRAIEGKSIPAPSICIVRVGRCCRHPYYRGPVMVQYSKRQLRGQPQGHVETRMVSKCSPRTWTKCANFWDGAAIATCITWHQTNRRYKFQFCQTHIKNYYCSANGIFGVKYTEGG